MSKDYKKCSKSHTPITFTLVDECPLCKTIKQRDYQTKTARELTKKYQLLHSTALEFSPEILI